MVIGTGRSRSLLSVVVPFVNLIDSSTDRGTGDRGLKGVYRGGFVNGAHWCTRQEPTRPLW
jgi:hypothetical protein